MYVRDGSIVINIHSDSSGNEVFSKIRILGKTHHYNILQVYVAYGLADCDVTFLQEGESTSGWELKNWIPEATDPGVSNNIYPDEFPELGIKNIGPSITQIYNVDLYALLARITALENP